MDNITPANPTGATATASPSVAPANDPSHSASEGPASDDAASSSPFVDDLLKRATQGAHNAVDSLAAKLSSAVEGAQGGAAKAGDMSEEWMDAARDAVRQHPIATVAGALLIGAALISLASSRRSS